MIGLPPSARRPALALLAFLSWPSGGCGSSARPGVLQPSGPWREDLALAFDDGVDFIGPLRSIMGTPWFDEYAVMLDRRVGESDLVAVVRLSGAVPDCDSVTPPGVAATLEDVLHGPLAAGGGLRLDFEPRSAACRSFAAARERLATVERFLVYVRAIGLETGEVRTRWHLSPADAELLEAVERVLRPPPPPP